MKLIILAAGYATRLYPLTKDRPKPLLSVAGMPMIEHVLEAVNHVAIDDIYVVTNEKFHTHFEKWAQDFKKSPAPITIVNDGTISNEDRLGAIGDTQLVIEKFSITDNILVIAGDNLLSQSLENFHTFCQEHTGPVVGAYDVGTLELAKQFGVLELDSDKRIVEFVEKPEVPKSSHIAVAIYYYPKANVPLIKHYLSEGNDHDKPGSLVEWMYKKVPFYACEIYGEWYDIGTHSALEEANQVFSAKKE
ncbi:MAG: glucose-1-phosphate thymidylyltransferase [Candidatus Woesearchaeota archaeon]|jgi:glucose-1-phosphate thymidylyltransferase